MIGCCKGTLRVLLSLALLGGGSAAFGETTYNFASVSFGLGDEFLPNLGASGGSGSALSDITTINLPVAFSRRASSYDIGNVILQPPLPATQQWSGSWQMGNSTGDGLYGTLSTTATTRYDFNASFGPYTVLTGYTGSLVVSGGTGFYAGASGGGSFESYIAYTGALPNGHSQYHSVNVDRLQVTLPADTGVEQTDTRGMAVLVLTGRENSQTGIGFNEGPIVSGSGNLPPLTHEVNNYTLVWPEGPPFIGDFLDTNETGDTLEGTYNNKNKPLPIYGFGYNVGHATFTKGTGAYKDLVGSSDFEVFSTGLGTEDGINYDYMSIIASRSALVPAAPVPEPESWAMLLVGFGVLGAYRARKITRLNAA